MKAPKQTDYCGDCGGHNSTVKDHQRTRKVGGTTVTTIGPLCDSCHRDRQHRRVLKKTGLKGAK